MADLVDPQHTSQEGHGSEQRPALAAIADHLPEGMIAS
jgi:hypothetical protein